MKFKVLFIFLLLPIFTLAQIPYEKAEQLIEKKQFKSAVNLLLPYVDEDSEDIKAIELLGDAYGHQKKWDEAIEQYKKLATLKPSSANYHYKYGGALGMKALSISKFKAVGIIGDVKREFLKAAELDPKHIDARWALVELYMSLPGIVGGSKSKSLKYANELEALSKVDGYLAKGYIYEYDDEPEKAEAYYKKAIQVGGSINCYEKLINLYESEKKPDDAISTLVEAEQKHQRNALHYQIGKVSADYGVQLDRGEKCLLVYLKNHSAADGVPKEWAYYRLAQIYQHKKNKDKALQYIDKALELKHDFKQAKSTKSEILAL
ncbi:tetratricopeptide repeat protein [Winogradskyella maritima]|uniref:Tetratricopeptide repeat protein n=1 Tax=Winogradskyella maritima TaxID=1517766 RepID=A0ABV8AKC6_9FLAO|nr:tetratricopeptide repeat protein [Winogradskyella maritima]